MPTYLVYTNRTVSVRISDEESSDCLGLLSHIVFTLVFRMSYFYLYSFRLGRAALFEQQSLNVNTFNLSIRVRCGSRMNIDRLFLNERRKRKLLGGSGGEGVHAWTWNLQSPLSWVSEGLRQDIYWLSKPFSRFLLGNFVIKNKLLRRNLTDSLKTVETGVNCLASVVPC